MVEPLRVTLRQATQPQHKRLDALMSDFNILSRSGYADFLCVHGAVLPRLEQVLELSGVAEILPDWENRKRTGALSADMAELSLSPGGYSTSARRFTVSEMIGVLYVLEGARLGNAVILNQIQRHAPETAPLPLRFLRHGREATLWRDFVAWLNAQAVAADDKETAIEAARMVFRSYERYAGARSQTTDRTCA